MAFEQQAQCRKEKGLLRENFIKPHTFFQQRNGSETSPCLRKHRATSLSITSALCFVGISYGENELRAGAKCIGETAGGLSIGKGAWSTADFLTFLEFDFNFFSYEVAGPQGLTTSRNIPHLNQKPTDTIILNLLVCRGVICDCCSHSSQRAAHVCSQITELTSEVAANFKYSL